MFSLSCILIVLIAFGANAQEDVKGYPFGKLRLAEDGQNEELIASELELTPMSDDVQSSGVLPLSSPCTGSRPFTKLAYPKDKSKFVLCRDEFHYEVISCPINGEFNEQTGICNYVPRVLNKCERERPCLNEGTCQLLTNTTFKCNCKKDWTGDRCEIPLTSCATKPCGPGAECRILKVADYEQDYVCICHGVRGYGLNCQEVVPIPCSINSDQFYPFAFSQRAYIQCDAELIHFQPCGPTLYWNQDEKFCDRKRPAKPKSSKLIPKKISAIIKEIPQEKKEDIIVKEEPIETTTTPIVPIVPILPVEQYGSYGQKVTEDTKEPLGFMPSRVINRPHVLPNTGNQQATQLDMNLRQTIQSGRNQPMQQDIIAKPQQWVPPPTTTSTLKPEIDESEFKEEISSQQNQAFGSKPWLNQLPTDMKTQNNQRFAGQQQSWQGSQNIQNQPTNLDAPTVGQNGNRLQGFSNQNIREQESSWKPKPIAPVTDNQGLPSQQWQGTQNVQNQRFPEQNVQSSGESTGIQGQNSREFENSWQNRPTGQLSGNKLSQTVGMNTQNFAGQQQQPSWQNTQSHHNQQSWQNQNTNQLRPNHHQQPEESNESVEVPSNIEQTQTNQFIPNQRPQTTNTGLNTGLNSGSNTGSNTDFNNGRFQKPNPIVFKQDNQVVGNQQWFNRVQDVKEPNNQRLSGQHQSWENKNTNQMRPNLNQISEEPITDSDEVLFDNNDKSRTTNQFVSNQRPQTTVNTEVNTDFNGGRLSKPNSVPLKSENTWQGNGQKFPSKPHPDSMLVFKPTHWTDAESQESARSQSWSKTQQPKVTDDSSQFALLNHHQKGVSHQGSWSNNQQMQNVDDSKIQTTSDFSARPVPNSLVQRSQSGQTFDQGSVGKGMSQWQQRS